MINTIISDSYTIKKPPGFAQAAFEFASIRDYIFIVNIVLM